MCKLITSSHKPWLYMLDENEYMYCIIFFLILYIFAGCIWKFQCSKHRFLQPKERDKEKPVASNVLA
jgi:hypothetical protein